MSKLIKWSSLISILSVLFIKVYEPLMTEAEVEKASLALRTKNNSIMQQSDLTVAKRDRNNINITIYAPNPKN